MGVGLGSLSWAGPQETPRERPHHHSGNEDPVESEEAAPPAASPAEPIEGIEGTLRVRARTGDEKCTFCHELLAPTPQEVAQARAESFFRCMCNAEMHHECKAELKRPCTTLGCPGLSPPAISTPRTHRVPLRPREQMGAENLGREFARAYQEMRRIEDLLWVGHRTTLVPPADVQALNQRLEFQRAAAVRAMHRATMHLDLVTGVTAHALPLVFTAFTVQGVVNGSPLDIAFYSCAGVAGVSAVMLGVLRYGRPSNEARWQSFLNGARENGVDLGEDTTPRRIEAMLGTSWTGCLYRGLQRFLQLPRL